MSPSPDAAHPRSNSYDFMRFVAAAAVLYSHHFALAGLIEPRVPVYGEKYGELAVGIFFCLSGFLIYRSLEKTQDWARFFAARLLRVMPNLTVVVVVTSVATMVYYRNVAHAAQHAEYIARNVLLFMEPSFTVPGVFADRANAAINGPLWSLRYEVALYVLLFVVFAWAGKYRNWLIASMLLVLAYPWATNTHIYVLGGDIFELSRLGQMFLSGSLMAFLWPHWKNHAVLFGLVGIAFLIGLEYALPFKSFLNSMALAGATIGLGSSGLFAKFAKGGDGSYGIYICAWPIQQCCIMSIANSSTSGDEQSKFWLSMAVAFALTTAAGYLTWHLYEARCMRRVTPLAALLHRWADRLLHTRSQ